MTKRTYDFFLVHAKADAEFARALYRALVDRHRTVFLDEEGIRPGDPWRETVERALANTDRVVVIASRYSSHGHYNQEEMLIAIGQARGHERPTAVIPLLLDGVPAPHGLLQIHGLQARRDAVDAIADNLVWILETARAEAEHRKAPPAPPKVPRPIDRPVARRNAALAVAALLVAAALLTLAYPWLRGFPLDTTPTGDRKVVVGAKHILETNLLCAMMALRIAELPGYDAECRWGKTGGNEPFDALMQKRIHLYAEYSGTILSEYTGATRAKVQDSIDFEWLEDLKARDPAEPLDRERLNELMEAYVEVDQVPLQPRVYPEAVALFGFDNEWKLLLSRSFVDDHPPLDAKVTRDGLRLDDLLRSDAWTDLRVCSYPEFGDRVDGLRGLRNRAGKRPVRSVDYAAPTRRYCRIVPPTAEALCETPSEPWCDLVDGYGTDPEVDLLVEGAAVVPVYDVRDTDGRYFWPPYHPVALARSDFVDGHPAVVDAVRDLHECIGKDEFVTALVRTQYGASDATMQTVIETCEDPGSLHVPVEKLGDTEQYRERVTEVARDLLARIEARRADGRCAREAGFQPTEAPRVGPSR